ncbi:transcription factor bHLH123-like [Zingiber officinale]|uniref:BHLH domain-containing protein n=1 Tax=Zingiber officinale TaxID=94328 RepID=A0A8J5FXT6_ZINOF|nr:transcription factor bHLH123-like [Zingiber officinale]KAG6497810.1 hypothetical protein ZIOFF_045716 [Zingiber officinale]
MAEELIASSGVGSWWSNCSVDGFMISAPVSCSAQHTSSNNANGGFWNSAALDTSDEAPLSDSMLAAFDFSIPELYGCSETSLQSEQGDSSRSFQTQQVSQFQTDQNTVKWDGSHQILFQEGFALPEVDGELQQLQPVDTSRCMASVAKVSSETEPAFKKPRIETPSSMPTFKVRKEKLGDRITALQQLVSPFGKTDTASVLHEAIDYIKFLHDQVRVLSAPDSRNCSHIQKTNEDLTNRGLCLVPVSTTFALVRATESDLWNSFQGGMMSTGDE